MKRLKRLRKSLMILMGFMTIAFLGLLGTRLNDAFAERPSGSRDLPPGAKDHNTSSSAVAEKSSAFALPLTQRQAELVERIQAPETAPGDRIAAALEIGQSGQESGDEILIKLFGNMRTVSERRALAGCLLISGDLTTAQSKVNLSLLSQMEKAELNNLLVDVSRRGINPPEKRE